MKRLSQTLSTVLIALTLAACGGAHAPASTGMASPPLASLQVQAKEMPRQQIWDGTVEAVNSTVLSAQTNARVLALPYDVNDVVPEGAVLVRFTDVEQKSATRAAQAQIASARATYVNAQANYRRVAAIFAKGLIARADLDQALAQRDAASAALNAAQANWREIGQQQDYTVVRAPYAGIVTRRYVQVGEAVVGPPFPQQLIAITSLRDLRVQVKVPQDAAAAIRRYGAAQILPQGGGAKRIDADKVTVFPYADPATHTFDVRVDLPDLDAGLFPGMSASVAFATGSTRRLLVPASALWRNGEITGVYVIHGGTASLRMVRLGPRFGDEVEVISGLQSGETIARDPLEAVAWLTREHRGGKAPAPDARGEGD
jgi:RND family efflux transporter MFP subunit